MTGPALAGRVAIASRNAGKIREIRQIFGDLPIDWVTDDARAWPEVEETGETYLENALLKARATAAHISLPVVADDSGIEVDVLDGRPGVRSARFAGPKAGDAENLQLLIASIAGVPAAGRTARYRCVAVAAWPDGHEIHAEATCEGTLVAEPRGSGGFGYDPIFVPVDDPSGRTMAELTPAEKDAISHRGRAFRELHQLVVGEGKAT